MARDAGFGREVRAALATRRQWLLNMGLAEEGETGFCCHPNMISTLARRDLQATAANLRKQTGREYRETADGDRIDGIVRRRVELEARVA